MANGTQRGSSTIEQTERLEDDLSSGGLASAVSRPTGTTTTTTTSPYAPTQRQAAYASGEVTGDEVAGGGETGSVAGAHSEVGNYAGESGEEFIEASEAQLAAESGEESAVSDLRSIEGFEGAESGEESAAPRPTLLREAGEGIEGSEEEFFPALAALVPTLVSAIGPSVANAVKSRLSPKARRVIQRVAKPAGAVATAIRPKAGNANLLAMIAKLIQQAQAKPGGESGAESAEARVLIEEAVAQLEVIIGTDDRVRIQQTTTVPWRRICALRIHFPSGATYRGTGFLIGPRAVATAGHCVYLHNQGGWARRIEVIPGCNGTQRPFGQAESTTFRSVGGWVNDRKPESDYGCVVLPPGSFGGKNLGSFGFAAFDGPALLAQSAVLAGFPGDKPFAEMWGMARKIKIVTDKTLIYDIDTMGGQSGAAVYIKRNGQRYVIGIHNYGSATGNSATRVTRPVYERLLAWSKL